MKRIINIQLLTGVLILFLVSCEKDIPHLTLDDSNPKSPKLSATETNIVLLEARESNTAVVFNWTKPEYNFNGSFRYTLQFAMAGTDFANPANEGAGTDLTKIYTEKAFNALMLSLGIQPSTAGNLEVRLRAVINDSLAPLYSNVHSMVVTPFPTDQFLYAPGDYQGWDPATAAIVRAVNKDKKYEGYLYFAGGTGEFKLTDAPNWSAGIFGDELGGSSGKIASPGDNFKLTPPGFYKFNANLNDNTWTAVKTAWGLIGSATPDAWNSDQDMAYDATEKKWTITLDLVGGEIKFRANDDWAINFGDDGANSSLEYNGANIGIASGGNYTITLDLHEGGKYTYGIKKN